MWMKGLSDMYFKISTSTGHKHNKGSVKGSETSVWANVTLKASTRPVSFHRAVHRLSWGWASHTIQKTGSATTLSARNHLKHWLE